MTSTNGHLSVAEIIGTDESGLLARLRGRPETAALPVVICSSQALSAEEQAAFRAQGCAVLPKRGRTATALAEARVQSPEVSVHG